MIDIWGFSKKEKKRRILQQNKRKGRAAEEQVRFDYQMRGYHVQRTSRGHDYKAVKKDIFTGKVTDTKYIEVKSGRAKTSKLQNKHKKQKKGRYKVERRDPFFF